MFHAKHADETQKTQRMCLCVVTHYSGFESQKGLETLNLMQQSFPPEIFDIPTALS